MYIATEETPNPMVLKFLPDDFVRNGEPLEVKTMKQAKELGGLAMAVMETTGVSSIFIGRNFISVTKLPEISWSKLRSDVLMTLLDFYNRDGSFDCAETVTAPSQKEEDSEIVQHIKELIEIKVRPAVAADGGDITFVSFEDGIVKLELRGSCAGCPSSTITLKNGIETMLKHHIPEVISVEQII